MLRDSLLYGSSRLPLLDAMTTAGMLGADRHAREEAVRALALAPGERVLDLACGTGRLLPRLADAVGPAGAVVGVDASAALLRRARARVEHRENVELRCVDARELTADVPADAAVCVLGLTVIPSWRQALERMVAAVAPGGRIAIVDWLLADGQPRPLRAYMRFGSWLAHADPARPIADASRALLPDASARRLAFGLQLVHGRVPD